MRWSYTIGKVAGTEVKVHITFLLLLGWFAIAQYQEGGGAAALDFTLFFLAFFGCIVLHEFGHITMARRFGVRTPDVLLLPIGGVARLERIPDVPKQEFLIALAGPLVTVGIILILILVSAVAGVPLTLTESVSPDVPFTLRLLAVNIAVLLFNLVPAFPLDGGRLLRALLASRYGLARATRIAGSIGQFFAVAMGAYALTQGLMMWLLVAVFIFLAAGSETSAVATRLAGQGLQVAQMMVTDFRTIPVHATLSQAVDLLLAGEQREFPVVDNLGRTEGMLTRDNLIRGLSQRGPESTVAEAMTAAAPVVAPTLGFQEALDRLRSSGLPALPVVDAGGALVGLLTLDNITDLLLIRRVRG